MIVNENGKKYIVTVKENGDKFWYLNNKLHRETGPAIELAAGGKVWCLDGIKFSDEKAHQKSLSIIKTAETKKYYDVKVEVMLPATLTYKVLAKNAEEAATLIKNMAPNSVQHRLAGKREIKLTVFDAGSTLIRFIKNIVGL